jgi:hypothetical protein
VSDRDPAQRFFLDRQPRLSIAMLWVGSLMSATEACTLGAFVCVLALVLLVPYCVVYGFGADPSGEALGGDDQKER